MAVIAQLRKYIQPAAYAAFSPKNSRAYETNDPEEGRCSTSSPRARRMKKAKTPQMAKTIASAGPADARRPPAPRNSPVPIAPPMAIICSCRGFSPWWNPSCSCEKSWGTWSGEASRPPPFEGLVMARP
jgi:hypothetical protein